MISTLHFIVPNVVKSCLSDEKESFQGEANFRSRYRRALRLLHPDKVKSDLNVHEKLMAHGLFSILTEQKRKESCCE